MLFSPTTPQVLSLAGPPLIGAFIGYLTNKIAIRMLFRPLRPWHVFGLRVPMTPGVIPAKRGQLAINIGNMVGEHLLTSRDVGEALSHERFQEHLRGVIDSRVGELLVRDLGSVVSLVPEHFQAYLTAGVTVLKHQLGDIIQKQIHRDYFEERVGVYILENFDYIGGRTVEALLGSGERAAFYDILEGLFSEVLGREQSQQWLAGYLRQTLHGAAGQGKTLGDLLPEPFQDLLRGAIGKHTPVLLQQLAHLLREEPVRDRIIVAIRGGVDHFLASLGPIGAMASGFLKMESLEGKIREYLADQDGAIAAWLQHEEVRDRFETLLLEQLERLLDMDMATLLSYVSEEQQEAICGEMALQVLAGMRTEGVRKALAALLRENLENWFGQGERTLQDVMNEVFSPEKQSDFKEGFAREIVAMFRTNRAARLLSSLSGAMVDSVLGKPIGQLAKLMPRGVRSGLTNGLVNSTNSMLLKEVPGLVDSLNIRRIVTEKVDSLDLLQVERLLLSIMEEQFKYINLFGALLGFLIGLLNLAVPLFMR